MEPNRKNAARALIGALIAGASGIVGLALGAPTNWNELTKTEARVEARSLIGLEDRRIGRGPLQTERDFEFELVSLGAIVKNTGTETARGVKVYVGTLDRDGEVHSQRTEGRVLAPKQTIQAELDLNGRGSNGVMLCVAFDGGMGTSRWRLFFAYDLDNFNMRLRAEDTTWPLQDVGAVCGEQMKVLGPLLAAWNREYRR